MNSRRVLPFPESEPACLVVAEGAGVSMRRVCSGVANEQRRKWPAGVQRGRGPFPPVRPSEAGRVPGKGFATGWSVPGGEDHGAAPAWRDGACGPVSGLQHPHERDEILLLLGVEFQAEHEVEELDGILEREAASVV